MRSGLRLNLLGALCLTVLVAAGPPEAPVADAAMRGDVEAVRSLLQEGADVNGAQGDGMSALHWAAEHADAQMAAMLLYAGAEVEAYTRIGMYTPLHVASRSGSVEVVELLLEAGADVEARTTTSGVIPLHLASASGNAELVTLLVNHGSDPNARETQWGQTPLIFAAALDRADAIEALLAAGADPNLASTTLDLRKQAELSRAARDRSSAVLEEFTNDGQEPPTPSEVQAAVMAGREILVSGEIPKDEEEDEGEEEEDDDDEEERDAITSLGGLTPLLHAARQGHLAAAGALLDGGADVNQVGGGDGTTPLLMATINGQFDLATLFLERGADPNIASTLNGATPLWATVNSKWQPRTRFPQPQQRGLQSAGYLEVMEALLKAGAEPDARMTLHPWYMVYSGCGNRNCGLIDTNGSTPFLRAAYATDVAAMRLLVAYGADPHIPTRAPAQRQRRSPDESLRERAMNQLSEDQFEELSDSARTAALVAVRDALPDSVKKDYSDERLAEDPERARAELVGHAERAAEARANERDPSGLPPVEEGGPGVYAIHAASGVGYGEGFAGNAHMHVPNAWLTAVKYLVEELGADVNARDHNAYTALHHAAARGDDAMILYLVEQGADVTVVSRRGQTTADMANGPVQRVSPFPATVALLESLGSINNNNCVTCD